MRKTTFQITAEHIFTSISAFRADNKSYIPTFVFQGSRNTLKTIVKSSLFSTISIYLQGVRPVTPYICYNKFGEAALITQNQRKPLIMFSLSKIIWQNVKHPYLFAEQNRYLKNGYFNEMNTPVI